MSLDFDYPTLTAMLDRYFRPLGSGDEAAARAFVSECGDGDRDQVLIELDQLAEAQHDPYDLRAYLMVHRYDILPEEGAEAWLATLRDLIARADSF